MPTSQSYFKDCGGDFTKLCLTLVTPWTIAQHSPLSTGFPRQEHWSGLPFPSPADTPDPGVMHMEDREPEIYLKNTND